MQRFFLFCKYFSTIRLFDNKALVSVFSKAKEEGMIICADMVSPRLNEKLEDITEALSYVDYFFPNFEEASEMTGETDEAKSG